MVSNVSDHIIKMDTTENIGIIGSGLIGSSWAMIFASAGYKVTIYDIEENQVKSALENINRQLFKLESEKVLRGNLSASQQVQLIEGCNDLKVLVEKSAFLQECIPERINLKRDLYKRIDEIIGNKTILSTSTSTFLPSLLSEGLTHKSQFVVSHPVNPPYFVPLVEIVPAPWTASWIVETTTNLMRKIGQVPIALKKEVPGFALNRIQYAILNECYNLIEDDVISVGDMDKVMTDGLGMRYAFLGPLETAHLNAEGFSNYIERYSDSMYAVSKTFKPIPKISGPVAEKIADQLEQLTPLEKLADRRCWRDESLVKLSQLKKNN